jgi:hypothetical protein
MRWLTPVSCRGRRAQLRDAVSPMMLSFMSESRRLRNDRIVQELGMRLRYPTVRSALAALPAPAQQG